MTRLLVTLLAILVAGTHTEAKTEIWYGPLDDRPSLIKGTVSETEFDHPDFRVLINDTVGWNSAATHTSALLFAPFFIAKAPDSELMQIASFANSHGHQIWIALQAALMTSPCGQRTEGLVHGPPQAVTGLIARLKKLSIPVAGFAFDEPFNNAVSQIDRPGIPACHLTAMQTAQSLVTVTNGIKNMYPAARIVDIESPLFRMTAQQAVVTVPQWVETYQQVTGVKLDGVALDTYYAAPGWAEAVKGISAYLHAHNQRVMLYALSPNFGPGKTTDESWIANTKSHVDAMVQLHVPIDVVIVESWMGHPANNLPETGNGLTSIINYVARSSL